MPFKRVRSFLQKPNKVFRICRKWNLLNWMSDEKYLKKLFQINMGYSLNLAEPKTFSEKLQWLKIYDRNPMYTNMVDKYEVKRIVSEIIGEEYIIPTYGVWDKFDDIDFDALPGQFVVKCTHDSGGLVVVKDKTNWNKLAAKKKINKSLKKNYYYSGREWPYKNVKPKIIVEKYMEDTKTKELRDYKFFTFDGKVKTLFVATDRMKGEHVKFDFFDAEYNHLDIKNGHLNADTIPEKPRNFEEMKVLAEKLAKGIPHVRVDFYEVNGKVYFGEMTFYHWSGLVKYEPQEWDEIMGSWITLPKNKRG